MNDHSREEAFAAIRHNIEKSGHHVYLILPDVHPRFAYTIGLREKLGFELLLAGATNYSNSEALQVINVAASRMPARCNTSATQISLGDLGTFTFRDVHTSWANELMLGALDYFGVKEIAARQIVPDESHWTIDVPDTSVAWDARSAPVWRHLHEPWTHPFSPEHRVTTNLAALGGASVTEAFRRDEDHWAMFAGSGLAATAEETRTVTLSTLLLADESLMPIAGLAVGKGLRRTSRAAPWVDWPQA